MISVAEAVGLGVAGGLLEPPLASGAIRPAARPWRPRGFSYDLSTVGRQGTPGKPVSGL